jgi:hypothetical protein
MRRLLFRLAVTATVVAAAAPVIVSTAAATSGDPYTAQTCAVNAQLEQQPSGNWAVYGTVTASVQTPTAYDVSVDCHFGRYIDYYGSDLAAARGSDFFHSVAALAVASPPGGAPLAVVSGNALSLPMCTSARYWVASGFVDVELGCDDLLWDGNSFRVMPRSVVNAPELPTVAVSPADDCATSNVADGYVGTTYVGTTYARAATESVANGAKVCVRATNGGVGVGGRFMVGGTTAAPAYIDADSSACAITPGNTLPGPHPLLYGVIGAPGNPAYAVYDGDAYSNGTQVWVCFSVTNGTSTFAYRAAFAASAGAPTIAFVPDTSSATGPATVNPGSQSGACTSNAVNVDTAAGHTWIGSRTTATTTELCARVQGGVTAGGRLVGSAMAPVTLSADTSACTASDNVIHQDSPVLVEVRVHAATATVCVRTAAASYAVSPGPVVAPDVSWHQDA